jgi:hypothetical protein
MANLKAAIAWLSAHHSERIATQRALDRAHLMLLAEDTVQLTAHLYKRTSAEIAVHVLKACGRYVPRNWLDSDRPTGIYPSRERLVSMVWQMLRNNRLVSEVARETGIRETEVNAIVRTHEGWPEGLELTPHHRGRERRGLLPS